MVSTMEQTRLWERTFAAQSESDKATQARERLRSTFTRFRERVALLVGEIHRDLPEYTVHDITHLDALWEMADVITDEDFLLTPTETFVFGGAVLLHDAGMSLAAYPEGFDALRHNEVWADILTKQFILHYNRPPTQEEILNPSESVRREVIGFILRSLHAQQAEKLAFVTWRTEPGAPPEYLIEDNQIRLSFGQIIGRIAHSHWWPVSRLEREFTRVLGAPPWCPDSWVVDPLKIACLLRVADASHIDSRRAPSFLRALRRLSDYSDRHWRFQEKLQKPYLSGDALTYTSGYAFPLEDAEAWWLCLDVLGLIDGELRQVDALLADRGLPRLAARRVAGIESPERFASHVLTDGWLPVDAYVQVSDVPRLINYLGGEELYGKDATIALRELIQNAADAIRARRLAENRPSDWGTIRVHLGSEEQGEWLEVQDNGIGMSSRVLTQYLLDFGTTYWGSDLMIEEFPGLLATGITPTGKYGIGFFSIFMLGSAVRVHTRRYYTAQSDTLVLEFNTGPSSRQILRPASKHEQIRDGGTCVRIWLERPSAEGLFQHQEGRPRATLDQLCRTLCPSLDVNVVTQQHGEESIHSLSCRGWIDEDSLDFFRSICDWDRGEPPDYELEGFEEFIFRAGRNLTLLVDEHGEVVGRACIALDHAARRFGYPSLHGVVTVGGLRACGLTGIAGILTGEAVRTARDTAVPFVSPKVVAAWASEQAKLVPQLYKQPEAQMYCAKLIRQCGGNTGNLPIGRLQGTWVSYSDIVRTEDLPGELYLLWIYYWEQYADIEGFKLSPNVVIGDYDVYDIILQSPGFSRGMHEWPSIIGYAEYPPEVRYFMRGLQGAVLEAASEAWGVPVRVVVSSTFKEGGRGEKKTIGYVGQTPVMADVTVIRKPNSKDRGELILDSRETS
jgi:hypothetical protein